MDGCYLKHFRDRTGPPSVLYRTSSCSDLPIYSVERYTLFCALEILAWKTISKQGPKFDGTIFRSIFYSFVDRMPGMPIDGTSKAMKKHFDQVSKWPCYFLNIVLQAYNGKAWTKASSGE